MCAAFTTFCFTGVFSTTGDCSVIDDCFRSPNYPSHYGDSQSCTITVHSGGILAVNAFNTESRFDKLTVNGVVYSGSSGPSGVSVSAGATITWLSDSSSTRSGFEICLQGMCVPRSTIFCSRPPRQQAFLCITTSTELVERHFHAIVSVGICAKLICGRLGGRPQVRGLPLRTATGLANFGKKQPSTAPNPLDSLVRPCLCYGLQSQSPRYPRYFSVASK